MAPQCFFDRSIIRHFIRALVHGFIGLTLTTLTVSTGAMEFALAYEPMAVVNGGAVKGMVLFSGAQPDPSAFKLHRYPDQGYCDALSDGSGYRLLREVLVGPQGGLKDVIVTIEGVKSGKPFELEETKLEANICQERELIVVAGESSSVECTFKAK